MVNLDTSYGSDQNGLVWGYRFTPAEPAVEISSEAAATRLVSAPSEAAPGEFYWLHFSLSNAASEPWLQRTLDLPDAFFDSLKNEVGATRLELEGDTLVAVLNDVLFDFSFDTSAVSSTSLVIEPRFLVSIRLRPLRSVDQLRAAVRSGLVFRSPVDLLAHLLREQAEVLVDILRRSTRRVDAIEDRLLAGRLSDSRSDLGLLRRVLVRLQRLLAPEPAALFRLLNRPPDWVQVEDLQELQQAAEEFSAAVGDAVALGERVKLLQEELAGRVNEQTNRTLFVLTMVTVIALPINLVAGLFGMNVGGIPFAGSGHGFWAIIAVLAVLTATLAYVALVRRNE